MIATETKFQKVKKKYALNNSYFKFRAYGTPGTPLEIMQYFKEHGDLPFLYSGTNWLYDCYCEYQKRHGVYQSQFFTPDSTAQIIAEWAPYFLTIKDPVLDACCGFGQLTTPFVKMGYQNVTGFDYSQDMVNLYELNTNCKAAQYSIEEYEGKGFSCIVSNPPYEIPTLTQFIDKLHKMLTEDGTAILLIPKNTIDKKSPKALAQAIQKFVIVHRQDMKEKFERTAVSAEIVVLEKR